MMNRFVIVLCFLAGVAMVFAGGNSESLHPKPQSYDGWKLGVQTWSFKEFSLFEAIDKTRSLGLGYIQAYPGQKISSDINGSFGPDMTEEQKQAVKDKLTDAGVELFAFGVVGVSKEEAGARKLFEFAKEMKIPTIVAEPEFEQFDLIDELCKEYRIKLAIHNHPARSRYWDPDTVLKMCEGRSEWIGACADVGHWARSGLDPVECLKKLEGRIVDLHIKEVANGHDVIWGTGDAYIGNVLKELDRQGYEGTFSIEYEYHWDNNVPYIRKSVDYFDSVAQTLKPTGWKKFVDEDMFDVYTPGGNWSVDDGEVVLDTSKGRGDIWSKKEYGDFVMDMEYKFDKGANSGVFIRAGNHNWLPWIEVQVVDSYGKPIDRHVAGAIYDVKEPSVNAVKPAGQWNRMTITAKGSNIKVVLNNEQIIDIDLDDWAEAGKNPDGTKNKFGTAYKDLPGKGIIGLQDHGNNVSYRNIKICPLGQ